MQCIVEDKMRRLICFATYLSQHTKSNLILWKVHVSDSISLGLFNFLRASSILQRALSQWVRYLFLLAKLHYQKCVFCKQWLRLSMSGSLPISVIFSSCKLFKNCNVNWGGSVVKWLGWAKLKSRGDELKSWSDRLAGVASQTLV